MMNCKARQYSDQMACGHCGLQWDVNDPDPPQCLEPKGDSKELKAKGNAALKEIKEYLTAIDGGDNNG